MDINEYTDRRMVSLCRMAWYKSNLQHTVSIRGSMIVQAGLQHRQQNGLFHIIQIQAF